MPSNNNPKFIAQLFLDAITKLNGCPKRVRSDCDTENVDVAAMQSYLRRSHSDDFSGVKAHIYGPSHGNQRIESWWSQYHRNRSSFIIEFFRDIVDSGYNPSNGFQLACFRYCFGPVLQRDLDEVVECWNSHLIRKSGFATVSGRPDVLYFLPESIDRHDHIQHFDSNDLIELQTYVTQNLDSSDSDQDLYEYFSHLVTFLRLSEPTLQTFIQQKYCHLKIYET